MERRTLSVVTPEVAMMIDTSLNVDDDSLVAGIVSFLLSFYFSSRISFYCKRRWEVQRGRGRATKWGK